MDAELQKTEKCGVFAIVGKNISSSDVKEGFRALFHRGDDSVGLFRIQDEKPYITHHSGDGEDFFENIGTQIDGSLFLGHNRYTTSSVVTLANAQPFLLKNKTSFLSLAHNGNIPDACVRKLRKKFQVRVEDEASDSLVVAHVLFSQHQKYPTWMQTFLQTLPFIEGAFAFICATETGCVYAMRDPWGIRPLCLGRKKNNWVVASETVAFDAMNADYVREIKPGELVCLRPDGTMSSIQYAVAGGPEQRCLLETIYFSNKKSFDGNSHIWEQRRSLGREVGKRFLTKKISIDLIIPILNSGKEVTMGVAQVLGMDDQEAIHTTTKKRSFIQNTQDARKNLVFEKHIVDGKQIEGKRILLCDDSLVRGTSLGVLLEKIKAHNPTSIHIVLGCEPVIDICDLGIDLPSRNELLGFRAKGKTLAQTEKNVARELGVDSITYLPRSAVERAVGKKSNQMCWHCFGGKHPINERKAPKYVTQKIHRQSVALLALAGE